VFSPSFLAAFTSDNWRIANFERPLNPADFGDVRRGFDTAAVRFFTVVVVRFFAVVFRLTVDFFAILLIFNKLIFRFD
jgi:hypothetical protein